MPIYKTKNENFFKKWTPEMAYVLGFFTADGNMIKNKRGAHFIEFQITDKKLLEKIRKLLSSNHKVTVINRKQQWKTIYRLQIGSKIIFNDLLKLGLIPHKSKMLKLPKIPKKYFNHFLRGYFDGDGNAWTGLIHKNDRKTPSLTLISGFTCGSKNFLKTLMKRLKMLIGLEGGSFRYYSGAFRLHYSSGDSLKLYKFMYKDNNDLCLQRKKIIFDKFLRLKNGPVV